MKAIIFAPATAGKTTLIRYLRQHTDLPVAEMEEEFIRLHGPEYPHDQSVRQSLIRQAFSDVVLRKEILFFCNTDFLSHNDIIEARKQGFVILQLDINLQTMMERNTKRMSEEGYPDASQWFSGMLDYQQRMQDKGLVDYILDASLPTEHIAQQLADVVEARE